MKYFIPFFVFLIIFQTSHVFSFTENNFFDPPFKQIKAGVALVDIKCNEGKNLVYKYNRMRAACVTESTENRLISSGWATLRLGLPHTENIPRDLCNFYNGKWNDQFSECLQLENKLQCSLMGGQFSECESACRNDPKYPNVICTDNCVEVCDLIKSSYEIQSFEECAAAGNPVMESFPRQCSTSDGKHFVEIITNKPNLDSLDVQIRGEKQVRVGTTHTLEIQVLRGEIPIEGARVFLDIEDYGEDIIKEFKGFTNSNGILIFSWEIPQKFDDIETLIAVIDVTDDISSKTVSFQFQVYCLPGEKNCKVEGN